MTETQTQIAELEAKILQLRSSQITELRDQLHAAKKTVANLEGEIAKITGKAPVTRRMTAKEPGAAPVVPRQRTRSEDVKAGILKVLAATPTGLNQKAIADAAGLSYMTVIAFLKKNAKDFKTTGKLKGKRVLFEVARLCPGDAMTESITGLALESSAPIPRRRPN